MKDTFRTCKVIRDANAATVFTKPLDLRFLSPFIGRPRLASEVARELGVPLSTLAYRIRKLQKLGLLRVARIEKRSGSSLKYLCASANAFFVPFEATDAETLEVLLKRWDEPWSAMFHRGYAEALSRAGEGWGISVWRDRSGELRVAPQMIQATNAENTAEVSDEPMSEPPALDELILGLRLTPEEVQALREELLSVLRRYADRQSGEGGSYPHFLRVMLTPLAESKVLR